MPPHKKSVGLKNRKYRGRFSKTAAEVMQKNERFLLRNSRGLLDEVIELANDAIDQAIYCTRKEGEYKQAGKLALVFCIRQVILPLSNAIYIHLLIGNFPACFKELRFMTEMLAKCCVADYKFSDMQFFGDRIKSLQQSKEYRREIKVIQCFDDQFGFKERAKKLWRELSDETHAFKYLDRLLKNMILKENVPGYSIILPIRYSKLDADDFDDLQKYIADFRAIMHEALRMANLIQKS